MNFHKYSQKIIYLAAIVWAISAFFKLMSLKYLYIFFGAIVLYVGIQNMIILNLGIKRGQIPEKIVHYQNRLGEKNGILFYAVFSVLMFILFGVIIIFSALHMSV